MNVRNEDSAVYSRVKELGNRVHVTGNLSFQSLRATVARAECLIMPSYYEGVGLPPLEAMAVGTPVLSSDIPSLRETCGDAAIYFDPASVDSMSSAILNFLGSKDNSTAYAAKGKLRLRERESSIDPRLPLSQIAEYCGLMTSL